MPDTETSYWHSGGYKLTVSSSVGMVLTIIAISLIWCVNVPFAGQITFHIV